MTTKHFLALSGLLLGQAGPTVAQKSNQDTVLKPV